MKQIVEAFATLLVFVAALLGAVGIITVSGNVAAAKEYKADVIAEIEDSNFNPDVISSCISQAQAEGYTLTVTACSYDAQSNIQTAEVVLTYSYRMPVFGIEQSKTVRGIAR